MSKFDDQEQVSKRPRLLDSDFQVINAFNLAPEQKAVGPVAPPTQPFETITLPSGLTVHLFRGVIDGVNAYQRAILVPFGASERMLKISFVVGKHPAYWYLRGNFIALTQWQICVNRKSANPLPIHSMVIPATCTFKDKIQRPNVNWFLDCDVEVTAHMYYSDRFEEAIRKLHHEFVDYLVGQKLVAADQDRLKWIKSGLVVFRKPSYPVFQEYSTGVQKEKIGLHAHNARLAFTGLPVLKEAMIAFKNDVLQVKYPMLYERVDPDHLTIWWCIDHLRQPASLIDFQVSLLSKFMQNLCSRMV
jgi:hypothetical protein